MRGVLRMESRDETVRVEVGNILVGHLTKGRAGANRTEWLWSVAFRRDTGYAATRDEALRELLRRQGLRVEEGG